MQEKPKVTEDTLNTAPEAGEDAKFNRPIIKKIGAVALGSRAEG